jgi:hypothetical protein
LAEAGIEADRIAAAPSDKISLRLVQNLDFSRLVTFTSFVAATSPEFIDISR